MAGERQSNASAGAYNELMRELKKNMLAYYMLLGNIDGHYEGWYVAFQDGRIIRIDDNLEDMKSTRTASHSPVYCGIIGKLKLFLLDKEHHEE